MNQSIVQYLEENKEKYSKEELAAQLRQSGYPEEEIAEGLETVYGGLNAKSFALPVGATVKYAGFWVRCAAFLLDSFIVYAIVFALLLVSRPFIPLVGWTIGWALAPLLVFLYSIVMIYRYQATFGKRAVGVVVVSEQGERLSLGKICLREIIGKLLSGLILNIGYLLAVITKKKQALHDFVAGSVVVYKNPGEKKNTGIIIACILVGFFGIIAVVGILSAGVFMGLGEAREKAMDAAVKSTIASLSASAVVYYETNNTYLGFTVDTNSHFQECSGSPVINVSDDGSSFAIFGKQCSQEMYFCGDDRGISEEKVDKSYAKENTRCR